MRIHRVTDRRGVNEFIECAYRIRRHELRWVPPPRKDVKTLLDRNRHPFHQHAQVEYFTAWRGEECVGRIAAIENFAHNTFHEEKIGFFGFLDAEPEEAVFSALLEAAEEWARDRGLTHLRGPASFSTNEECGMLVEGFHIPPCIMMPWNPPAYPQLVEKAGYAKAKDLWSWWISEDCYNERFGRLVDIVLKKIEKQGLKYNIRTLDMSRFNEELGVVRQIYNKAWEKNWGFIPMTEAEIDHLAKELKPVIDPKLVSFVEIDGEPAGFSFTMPDYNIVLSHLEGKLGPKQIALFLLLRKNIRMARMLTMGVVEKYRKLGLEALLVHKMIENSRARGIHQADCGWILEDNTMMNRTLTNIGAQHYKTFRIYEKALGDTQ